MAVNDDLVTLAEILAGWKADRPDVTVHTVILPGEPVEVIVDASTKAGLMVVGRPHQPRLGSWTRSVARAVLRAAHCPLAIVPPSDSANLAPPPAGPRPRPDDGPPASSASGPLRTPSGRPWPAAWPRYRATAVADRARRPRMASRVAYLVPVSRLTQAVTTATASNATRPVTAYPAISRDSTIGLSNVPGTNAAGGSGWLFTRGCEYVPPWPGQDPVGASRRTRTSGLSRRRGGRGGTGRGSSGSRTSL